MCKKIAKSTTVQDLKMAVCIYISKVILQKVIACTEFKAQCNRFSILQNFNFRLSCRVGSSNLNITNFELFQTGHQVEIRTHFLTKKKFFLRKFGAISRKIYNFWLSVCDAASHETALEPMMTRQISGRFVFYYNFI